MNSSENRLQSTIQRRFFGVFFLALLIPSIFVVLGTYIVDPYDLYPDISKSDTPKGHHLFWSLRLHKPHRIQQVKPRHLILGTSRSARLPPKLMVEGDESVYNAAMPGATLFEIARTLEHAQQVQPLDTVLLGLDYSMFRAGQSKYLAGFETKRLRQAHASPLQNAQFGWQQFVDLWKTLYSRTAVLASLDTLRDKDRSNWKFSEDGSWRNMPGKHSGNWMYAKLAQQKFIEFSTLEQEHDMQPLHRIVVYCHENNIQLKLLLVPTHAHIMNSINLAGGWARYLEYQREVTLIAESYREKSHNVHVFGIENNVEFVFEPIEAQHPWFVDGVHFTPEAGREIMNCMYPNKSITRASNAACNPNFTPQTLDAENIDTYLANISQLKDEYSSARNSDFRKLKKQIHTLKTKLNQELK